VVDTTHLIKALYVMTIMQCIRQGR